MSAEWVAWLALTQANLSVLCLAIVQWSRSRATDLVWKAAAIWFVLQAADEVVAGNFFNTNPLLEYALLILYLATVTYYASTHEPRKTTP